MWCEHSEIATCLSSQLGLRWLMGSVSTPKHHLPWQKLTPALNLLHVLFLKEVVCTKYQSYHYIDKVSADFISL